MAEKSQRRARGKGRPFQKGESGNPGGRPKMSDEMRAAKDSLEALSPKAVSVLGDLLECSDPKVRAQVGLGIVKAVGLDEPQRHEFNDKTERPESPFAGLDPEELRALLQMSPEERAALVAAWKAAKK